MRLFLISSWLCSVTLLSGVLAAPVSPAEVQRRLDSGEKITFIDVRANALFKEGHLPGAINVPAALVPQKQLPPLGLVIVYDDGLGIDTATGAAAELSRKTGITAQVLEGGFASWESGRAATTKGAGLKPEATPLITYTDLTKVQSDNVVLVDLRKEPKQSRQGSGDGPVATPPEPLTDLRQEFTKVRGVTRSPFELPQSRQGGTNGAAVPLLVLIDDGDGSAQEMARSLKANGVTRYVVLAGGERVLARKGRTGTGRASSTIVVHRPPGSSLTTTNR